MSNPSISLASFNTPKARLDGDNPLAGCSGSPHGEDNPWYKTTQKRTECGCQGCPILETSKFILGRDVWSGPAAGMPLTGAQQIPAIPSVDIPRKWSASPRAKRQSKQDKSGGWEVAKQDLTE
ncbi:uncharacterized protein BO96DRAFT_353057 [Aspergillus niger CBS 101883]|uniref:Uncharacterized protein n=3 Tax=Aspergillus niger TaxID=5061 RepID=A2R9T5_ASPNC|nr:uncharacterized protein BO96DRAFT_353057 [Aspergillus niger CBS 101883]XP_059602852.1 hypothetical protein An18g00130 [Aspergillus niger]PYH50224.1 hypothetical protein BO96DRAFT_353057 [Aspergillus niger CBS 101883]RDH14136.1 hypothetical protein M747DRAFT_291030 [Aspergillus niger ATCC 13496]CAK43091.1 hypothetical protein An18g00130 [Aspergillus niger]